MSKGQLIALVGNPKTGKTSTITEVYKILNNSDLAKEVSESRLPLGKKKKELEDFSVVYEIFDIRVGICSEGDIGKQLRKNLNNLLEKNCQVILCPIRIRGGTVEGVNEFCKENSFDCTKQKQTSIPSLERNKSLEPAATKALRVLSNERTANYLVKLLLEKVKKVKPLAGGVL